MSETSKKNKAAQAADAKAARGPEINEVDGEPIFHAGEEEGDGDE